MVITIDGPAGVGKSTISARLANALGYKLLDTGAMYRAVTLEAQNAQIELSDPEALADFACECDLDLVDGSVSINGKIVGDEIRCPKVTTDVHFVADNLLIRKHLVEAQRRIGTGQKIVAEGRDQGTVVFPKAFCKFYLTASDEIRAERRVRQLKEQNKPGNYSEVLEQQKKRDQQDQSRPVGKLMKAFDAITIQTDSLSIDQVVDQLGLIAERKQAGLKRPACC